MNITRNIEKVLLTDSERDLIVRGWGNDIIDNVECSKIDYNSDGYIVEGYTAEPKDKSKKYPLILWNRGGDFKNGRLDNFLATGILGEIASWGYVAVSSQYRNEDEFGGKEINDVLNVLKIGMHHEKFDGENIGVEGWSRGGMMTYLLLTKLNFFKCAVVAAGLADLKSNFSRNEKLRKKFYAMFKNADEKKIRNEIQKRSAVEFYEEINSGTPLLLIHGSSDETIYYNDSHELYNKLKTTNRAELRLETIESGDHYLRKDRKKVRELRKEWFAKYLKLNS